MQKYLLDACARRPGQFRKDAIREGDFVNTNTGDPLPITRERLEKWQHAFSQMKANGVNVPIANGHDTEKPLGSIVNMMVVDDEDGKARLWCDYDFADDDAVTAAKRAKYVSIGTDPNYKDCEGNEYGEVIQHVAITPTPVITKQTEYVQLSRAASIDNQEKDMNATLKELALSAGVEVADDVTDEALTVSIKEKIAELAKRPLEIEKPEPVKLSQEVAEALTEAADARLSGLVTDGKITPAVSKDLKLALVGKDLDSSNALTLSRGAAERSVVNMVVDALAKNDPVELTKKAGKQILKDGERLSREGEETEAEKEELSRKKVQEEMTGTLSGQKEA